MAEPSSTPAPRPESEAIQRLVAEVLRRIRAEMAPQTRAEHLVPRAAALPAAAARGSTIAGRVIALSMLERLPVGTTSVLVEAGAVITPSAREYARDKGMAIERAGVGSVGPSAPFVIARAECKVDAASQAAALARSVPGGVQLPATGLADVIAALAMHASRDAARGILLCSHPVMASVLANRSPSLRAVTAKDSGALAAAAREAAANLLVVDPATFPTAGLLRIATEFAAWSAADIPQALAARPAGCGCKGH